MEDIEVLKEDQLTGKIIGTTIEQRKGGLSTKQHEYLCVLLFSSESSVAKEAT